MKTEYERWQDELKGKRPSRWPYVLSTLVALAGFGLYVFVTWLQWQ